MHLESIRKVVSRMSVCGLKRTGTVIKRHNLQSIPCTMGIRCRPPAGYNELTCTSFTTSYSSTSASLSIAVLLRILLKSVGKPSGVQMWLHGRIVY